MYINKKYKGGHGVSAQLTVYRVGQYIIQKGVPYLIKGL